MNPLIDKLKNVFSNGAATFVEKVGDALDKNITNKEELLKAKTAFEAELNRHTESQQANATKVIELELKDMADARNREIQIATSKDVPLINKIIQPVLALLLLGSCFVMWYTLLFKEIDKEKEMIIAGIVGSLTTIAMGVVGYYFGSSVGSKANGDTLRKIVDKG